MAFRTPQWERRRVRITAILFEYIETLVVAAVIVVLLTAFVARLVRVDGESMAPTLQDGDFLVSTHAFFKPERGNIVVITQPNEVRVPLIKRVIGLEGDVVDIDYETGVVVINGEALEEQYIDEPINLEPKYKTELPLTVPKGYLFVIGDNRNNSSDSRDSRIGLIDERYILGRTGMRLFPPSRMGVVVNGR